MDPTKTKMVITEGAADSMTKLAGGHVVLAIHSVAEAKAMAEGGKIKLLAVLAPKRVSYIPTVPTAEEQGVIKGVSVSWWAGISMPAATPDAIVRKWEAALAEMVKDPAFRAATDRLWINLDYLERGRHDGLRREAGRLLHGRRGQDRHPEVAKDCRPVCTQRRGRRDVQHRRPML